MDIDWGMRVITVYKADSFMTNLGGGLYELDVDEFRLALKDEEDSEIGMSFPDTHRHDSEALLSGVLYARRVSIINGYVVTFETGAYQVSCIGANHNIGDVFTNTIGPSLIINNSAGLQRVETGVSGLTPEESAALAEAAADADDAATSAATAAYQATLTRKATFNKAVISPDDLTVTIYDDDEVTPLIVFDISSDKRIRSVGT